jgi:hypothetical protein
MPKKPTPKKTTAPKPASKKKPAVKTKTRAVAGAGLAKAKALERRDAAKAPAAGPKAAPSRAGSSKPLRNSDFPDTYIKTVSVSLDDPNHWMTLTWTGPEASSQETGPFRTSPGAGMKGINCDDPATSRRSGTKCTPKGSLPVSGFQSRLNSDSRATFVTWFQRARGIALHYFPSVPTYAASHGCVRIESKRIAQLIQENSRIGLTKVVVDGTWTKPKKQW